MNKATIIRNIPNPKQVSDNLRIPIPTPDTVETVAIAVMTQIIIICKYNPKMETVMREMTIQDNCDNKLIYISNLRK